MDISELKPLLVRPGSLGQTLTFIAVVIQSLYDDQCTYARLLHPPTSSARIHFNSTLKLAQIPLPLGLTPLEPLLAL